MRSHRRASLSRLPSPLIWALVALVACLVVAPLSLTFLSAAPATLGYTSAGGSTDSGDANYMNGSRFTMGASDGTVSSMSAYVAAPVDAAPNNQFQLAIYTDSNGAPGALVASSASGTLKANAWNTVSVSATLKANTPYWLMYNTNGSNSSFNNLKYTGGSSGQGAYSTNGQSFGAWPATFGAATRGNEKFSIYATYTPSGSGGTPTPSPTSTPTSTPTATPTPAPPPVVSITAPASGATVSGTAVSVTASASSGIGIAGVQFQLDGANLGAEVTSAPYTTTWNSTTATNGTHSLTAIARDTAGTRTTSSPVNVTVSNSGPDPSQVGQWSGPYAWPLVSINMILLPTGKVLALQGNEDGSASSGSAYVWDPATGNLTNVPISSYDIFCAGNSLLTDGRAITIGGHSASSAGIPDASLFDPQTMQWSSIAPMNYARWYPTATMLPDGRILATGGATTCTICYVQIPEVYDAKANSWTLLNGASSPDTPSYPFMFVLPDGRVLQAGASEITTITQVLDVGKQTWTTVDGRNIDGGSAVMYAPGKIMKAGSAADSGNSGPSSANTYVLDMTQASPSWQQTASMAYPRAFLNLTSLPDGTVLATGGDTDKSGYNLANAVKQAELWNPSTQTWTTMAAMQTPRVYHSTALLLPDGRVLESGSGGDQDVPDEKSAEIYSPPYLFKGARPTITSSPSSAVPYGSTFFVGTPDAASIASVSLIRTGAVTHAFNQNARFMNLAFQQTSGGLNVQAPANANLAPPGYYMLFIVNSNGVPSIAPFITLPPPAGDTQPPTAPTNLAATAGTGSVALSWGASTDNVGVSSYAIYRSTSSGFTPSAANRVGSSTTTSYTDSGLAAGSYYYLVTAQDAAGNVSAPSNQATATVSQGAQQGTLGNTTAGSQFDVGDANYMNGSRFTMPANGGSAASISVYVGAVSAAPNNQFQVAIYTDNGGAPGTLVAHSATGQLTANAWNTLPISGSLSANTTYWLVYNTNGVGDSSNNMAYVNGGTSGWSNAGVAFGSWPASFGAATEIANTFSIYLTYGY